MVEPVVSATNASLASLYEAMQVQRIQRYRPDDHETYCMENYEESTTTNKREKDNDTDVDVTIIMQQNFINFSTYSVVDFDLWHKQLERGSVDCSH